MDMTQPKKSTASGSTRSTRGGSYRVHADSPSILDQYPDPECADCAAMLPLSCPEHAVPKPRLTSDGLPEVPRFIVERILPMAKLQAEYLRWVFKLANGNKAYAARLLQMDRTSFYRALKRAERIAPSAPLDAPGDEKAAQ